VIRYFLLRVSKQFLELFFSSVVILYDPLSLCTKLEIKNTERVSQKLASQNKGIDRTKSNLANDPSSYLFVP
jgi:hypothetical protein